MLKYGNIDREKRAIISLVRKSRRIHEFPLTNQLLNEIPDLDINTPIFPDLYETNEIKLGTKMSKPRKYMQALLNAENRKHATLHSFRVTYNNQLRDLGCSIEDRQKLLAHSSSETTKIYTHSNFELAQSYIDRLPNYVIK
jgi:integrase